MKPEILVYGLAKGDSEQWQEQLLATKCKSQADIERVKQAAAKDGFHSFRVAMFDGTPPDFSKVVNFR